MDQARKQNSDTFNTMHKLEQAGMSRTQAEITARAIDQQVSISKQEFLDRMDARFDAFEKRFEDRFDAVNKRIDAVEKRFSWVAIEGIVAISVLGVGFIGIILALLHVN